jgi:hypothetical protein
VSLKDAYPLFSDFPAISNEKAASHLANIILDMAPLVSYTSITFGDITNSQWEGYIELSNGKVFSFHSYNPYHAMVAVQGMYQAYMDTAFPGLKTDIEL